MTLPSTPGARRDHPANRTPTRRPLRRTGRRRLPEPQRHRAPVLPHQAVARTRDPLRQARHHQPRRHRSQRRYRLDTAMIRPALGLVEQTARRGLVVRPDVDASSRPWSACLGGLDAEILQLRDLHPGLVVGRHRPDVDEQPERIPLRGRDRPAEPATRPWPSRKPSDTAVPSVRPERWPPAERRNTPLRHTNTIVSRKKRSRGLGNLPCPRESLRSQTLPRGR